MKRSHVALALLSTVVLLPGIAEARGYGRRGGGYVNTPFGAMPMSAMQQAGGNPFAAQQMYQYQQQMKYQQQMMKAQQQYQQQMKKMGQNPNGKSQLNSQQKFQPTPTTHAKKKKKTTHTPTTTSASKKSDPAATK